MKLTGTGVFVRVIVGVGEMVGVKVSVAVGVAVSGSVGRGVAVDVEVLVGSSGGGVTGGGVGFKIEYSAKANKTISPPAITAEYLATGDGNFLSSFSVFVSGMSGCGAPPSAASRLLAAVA